MIEFCSLYSGSSGNSYFINVDGTKLLLEVGKSGKKIKEGLIDIGENIEEIYGIMISHEHDDHAKSLKILSKDNTKKIILSSKTKKSLEEKLDKVEKDNFIVFKRGEKIIVEKAIIKSFKISHDAVEPSGFSIFDKKGNKISVVTDLGEADDTVLQNLKGSKLVFIEANYDENVLKVSRYPMYLKQRIKSKYGHLSNDDTAKVVKKLINEGTEHIIIGHISNENNSEIIAYKTMLNVIEEEKKEREVSLEIAKREEHSNKYILE